MRTLTTERRVKSTHKNKLKMGKDLHVRLDTIKLLEKNIGKTLFDINCNNIFLGTPHRVTEMKTKIFKMGPD